MNRHDLSELLVDIINEKVISKVVERVYCRDSEAQTMDKRGVADTLAILWRRNLKAMKEGPTAVSHAGSTADGVGATATDVKTTSRWRLLEQVEPLPLHRVQSCSGAPPRRKAMPRSYNESTTGILCGFLKVSEVIDVIIQFANIVLSEKSRYFISDGLLKSEEAARGGDSYTI